MGRIQKTRRLLYRIAVATGAGLIAVVAGLGMAPAGADDVSAEAEAGIGAEGSSAVQGNGVTFKVNDIKALVSL